MADTSASTRRRSDPALAAGKPAPEVVPVQFVRPWLYPAQRAALYTSKRYAIIEASTKAGKTTGALIWLIERAVTHGAPGRNYWWIAPIFGQAEIAFRRMKRYCPAGLFKADESRRTITLFNGAVIWFKSAENPDSLYGEDVHGFVVDEASRTKEGTWPAIRSTITATRAPGRFIGNVRGRRNWAYKLARAAEAGRSEWHFARLTAWDAVAGGVLDKAEVESARDELPESVFRELYEAQPVDDGANPFGDGHITARLVAGLSSKPPVAWGWDLAKKADWTVGIAVDADGAVCRLIRFRADWEQTITTILRESGQTPGLIDSTGVGDPIVERVHRKAPRLEGFLFSAPSKQQIMEGLAVAIQRAETAIPKGTPLEAELREFTFTFTRSGGVRYTAPEGFHDDCVCALALALECKRRKGSTFVAIGRAA